MADRISSLDADYVTGMLSAYPAVLDDRETLYQATNNSETVLTHTLTYSANKVLVDSTEGFPPNGQIRLGSISGDISSFELITYSSKTAKAFMGLQRGFAGSKQSTWTAGKTAVTNSVASHHHNAPKDAIINIETKLGVRDLPAAGTLNAILKRQEQRFLAPKAIFQAFPLRGAPSLKVRFQNFSTGHIIRHLWDFGDGATSLEQSPTHTYTTEGVYTVKLNIVTSLGAQGIATKTNYIVVDGDESIPFFYVDSMSDPYSMQTATAMTNGTYPPDFTATPTDPKEFRFIDQTDGDITQRNWVFGDGETHTEMSPNVHEISHIFATPGTYDVTLLNVFANGRLKIVKLPEPLLVL